MDSENFGLVYTWDQETLSTVINMIAEASLTKLFVPCIGIRSPTHFYVSVTHFLCQHDADDEFIGARACQKGLLALLGHNVNQKMW